MGMDVFGRAPTSKTGEYFRNSIWYWIPLADVCRSLAPEICAHCPRWYTNDGDGLDAFNAAALAAVLRKRLEDGMVERIADEKNQAYTTAPNIPCPLCSDEPKSWKCLRCDGKREVAPMEAHLRCDVSNVANFAAFLADSGGFEIL